MNPEHTYLYNRCRLCGKKVRMRRPDDELLAKIVEQPGEVCCNRCFEGGKWQRLAEVPLKELADISIPCLFGGKANLADNCRYCLRSKECEAFQKVFQ